MCQKTIIITKNEGTMRQRGKSTRAVPCGKCAECVHDKVQEWAFRIETHLAHSVNPLFVTFTYDEKHLPRHVDQDTGEIGLPTLVPAHISSLIKNLRNSIHYHETKKNVPKNARTRVSHYSVGEYGTKTGRPHYHTLLFNLPPAYVQFIYDNWTFGYIDIRPLSPGHIIYVMKYLSKKSPKKPVIVSSPGLAKVLEPSTLRQMSSQCTMQMFHDVILRYLGARNSVSENIIKKKFTVRKCAEKLQSIFKTAPIHDLRNLSRIILKNIQAIHASKQ